MSLEQIEKQNNAKRIISLLLTLLWMALIFYMSSQTADDSSDMSSGITYKLCLFFVKGFKDMSVDAKAAIVEGAHNYVRKAAHLSEYTVLGILLSSSFASFSVRRGYIFAPLAGILYAATDEIHQLFVPGRSGELRDVCIDSIGVILGTLLFLFFIRIRSRKK